VSDRSPRLFIFGWDGADWRVIEKGWQTGRISTLRSIAERGQRGTLMSTYPPVTPTAWTSFMTGTGPGDHGIYSFVNTDPVNYKATFTPGGARKVPTLIYRLDREGYRTVQVTVPWTYPAEPVEHGAVVPGWDDPSESFDSTHPPEVAAELAGRFPKVPRRILHQFASVTKVLREHDESLGLTDGIYRSLVDRIDPDVAVLVWTETDKGAHRVWSRGPVPDSVVQIYDQVDRMMGRLIADYVKEDDTVLVVSDHGTTPIHTFVNLGPLLVEGHWITLKEREIRRDPIGMAKRYLWHPLPPTLRTRLIRVAASLVPRGVAQRRLHRRPGAWPIVWDRSKAFPVGTGRVAYGINVNLASRYPDGIVADADYEGTRDELIAFLSGVKDPTSGEPVFDQVVRREEVYSGRCFDLAPDIIPRARDGYATVTGFRQHAALQRHDWGGHRFEGIFALNKPLGLAQVESIEAILPKVLEKLDYRVAPEDAGFVAPEVKDFSSEEAAEIEEHLRALGYTE